MVLHCTVSIAYFFTARLDRLPLGMVLELGVRAFGLAGVFAAASSSC